ncbi:hypothetical protein K469DRAFT_438133, partial [Zopfia rhizophila CBS 207.26]
DILLRCTPPYRTVVGGDCNTRQPEWEPWSTASLRGENLATWAAVNQLAYIGEIRVPTHESGHVLDLTFSNLPFASASINDLLHPGADHAAI